LWNHSAHGANIRTNEEASCGECFVGGGNETFAVAITVVVVVAVAAAVVLKNKRTNEPNRHKKSSVSLSQSSVSVRNGSPETYKLVFDMTEGMNKLQP
jgi:anti-sigma-K factor RskA